MKNYRTGNYSHLRHQNLVGVMHYLYENAPISRVNLSRLTKLNKTTISSLVDELLENEFIREVGIGKTKGAGRSSVLLDINPEHGYMVSGEIGGNFIHAVCTDFSAQIVWQHKEPLEKADWDQTRVHLLEILERGVRFAKKRGVLLGLSLGVHGLVDKETGILLLAPNSGWRNVPLLSILREKFQTEIFVDNEANLAAICEQFFGAAKGHNNVLYVSLGRGLGGGIVINGQLYNGETGMAGEFGHMTINPNGQLCGCGNYGCWETEVNQSAIIRHLQEIKAANNSSNGNSLLSIAEIIEIAKSGDAAMLAALGRVGRQLGIGFSSLLNTLNPGLIVFGGELSPAADYILPAARSEMEKRALKWTFKTVEITAARFGSDAAIMGGVGIIFQSVLRELSGLKRKEAKSNPQSSSVK